MPNPVTTGYQSLMKAGWAMPAFIATTSSLVTMAVAFSLMWAVFILSIPEGTAKDTELILALGGTSAALWLIWLFMVWLTSNRMWTSEATSGVQHLSTATYDSAGAFYCSMGSSGEGRPSLADKKNDKDWRFGGIKYNPRIANGMIIKGAFAVKCVFKVTSLLVNLARGYIVEVGGADDTYRTLSFIVVACSLALVLDSLICFIIGGERGPCALVGKCSYGIIYGKAIPFQPVDATVHTIQQIIVAAELSPWGIVVPLLHEYVYDMQVTSSWAVPILSDYITVIYTSGAIFHKGCSAACMIGLAVHYGILSKPPSARIKDEVNVRAMTYSIWGPFVELKDEGGAAGGDVDVPNSEIVTV